MLDIKISGGLVADGTGGPARRCDIGIRRDRFAEVGDLSAAEARAVLDARERVVCPGFIDVHSHSDVHLLIEPAAPSKISQGITTEVVGNCGASAAPLLGEYRLPSDWEDKPFPGRWRTVAEYRELLRQARPAPNVVLLVGHNALRAGVVGYADRPAVDGERRRMVRALRESLEAGARGLSTGLVYPPGMFAARGEIVELAAVVSAHAGVYASHMRDEGARLPAAVKEALAIGRSAGVRVQVSHLKASGRANWPRLDEALALLRAAREDGMEVCADRYPYTAGCTDLDVIFPAWAQEGGRAEVLRRLRDPAQRSRLRDDLQRQRSEEDWAAVTIASTHHPDNVRFRGRPLPEVAEALRLAPADAVLHLAETDELRTTAFFFGMSEPDMLRILGEPYVMVGTDASLRAPTGPLSADYPHPRAYGTFPRFLRMALDGRSVPLPEAVRKLTSLPATHFRLKDRGLIARGMKADVVVFDPRTLRDRATYAQPCQFAEGVEHVIVNGVHTLAGGKPTGRRGGEFL
jgi:N-acyl-D-amino-acid deacylase